MTLKTCKIQYEIAKANGDKVEMNHWAIKAKEHGGSIEEEKPKEETKSKRKK